MAIDDHKVAHAQEMLARLPANRVAQLLGMSRDTVQRIARGTRTPSSTRSTPLTPPNKCPRCACLLIDGGCVRCRAVAHKIPAAEVRDAIDTLPREEVLAIVAKNSPRFRRPSRAQRLAGLHDPFSP